SDIVAAVKGDGDVDLAQHLHGSARLLEALALRQVQDLGQARIFVTAQRGVDDVIGNDACFTVIEPDAAQRPLRQLACVRDAQIYALQLHDAPFNLIQLDPRRDGRTDSKRNDPCQVV